MASTRRSLDELLEHRDQLELVTDEHPAYRVAVAPGESGERALESLAGSILEGLGYQVGELPEVAAPNAKLAESGLDIIAAEDLTDAAKKAVTAAA